MAIGKQTGWIRGVHMESRSNQSRTLILPLPRGKRCGMPRHRAGRRNINRFGRTAMVLFFVVLAVSPAAAPAETILLDELLPRIGLQPLAPELKYIEKGGSMTASLHEPSKLTALGFTQLKPSDRIHLQNLGDQFWLITNPVTGQTAKIRISRQNKPAAQPRIRIKLISLSQIPQGKKAK